MRCAGFRGSAAIGIRWSPSSKRVWLIPCEALRADPDSRSRCSSCYTLGPSAQQPPSPADIGRDLREAERLLKEQKLDLAMEAFQAVVDGAHALGLDAEETQAKCGLGETLNNRAEYARAKTVLQQCLDAAERLHRESAIGRASLVLSINADMTGQSGDAASFADRAVAAYDAAQDPRGRAVARLQQLRVRKFSPEEDQAITERIIKDARLAGDRTIEAGAAHSWGDHLFSAERFEEAFDMLTRARDLYHETGQLRPRRDGPQQPRPRLSCARASGRSAEVPAPGAGPAREIWRAVELMQSLNAVAVVGLDREHYRGAHATTSAPWRSLDNPARRGSRIFCMRTSLCC